MKFRSSFGFQLTCLVLIIVLPATLVTAYDFATSLSYRRESSYAYLQSVADQCAHDLDGLLRSTAAFLSDVSDLVETFDERRGALQPFLARILQNHPEYANIRILDREGVLLASAIPAQHPVSYDDRVEVRQAISGASFAVGRPVLGRITGVMPLPVAGSLYNYKAQIETQGIELAVRPLGHAACDRRAFVHVFPNLISNAVKYTRSRPLPRVEIGCDEGEGETVYYLRDNRIGFDMKYADKLTQVFQKLHPNHEGSGVGLAIVKRVVEKHGGKLWAVSAPGQGATFFFSLPKTSPPTTR